MVGCITHADASLSVTQQTVVTVELLVMVAGFQQGAGLPQLPGTHLTAATAIQDQAGPQRAGWGGSRAGTGLGTVLGHCLQQMTQSMDMAGVVCTVCCTVLKWPKRVSAMLTRAKIFLYMV